MARSVDDVVASVPAANRWKLDNEVDFEHRTVGGQIVPKHLGKIAESMMNWEGTIADNLGLSEQDRSDIRRSNIGEPKLQRREALNLWKRRLGTAATYKALIEVFIKADTVVDAEFVCGLFKDTDISGHPPQNPKPSPVRTEGETSSGVKVQIELLDQQYMEIECLVLEAIKRHKVPLDTVLNWIRFPPMKLRARFAEVLRQQAKVVSSSTSLDELFSVLSSYWNPIHPALLEYLINKLGDPDLKTRMDHYLEELCHFRIQTTVGEFLDNWVGGVPPDYSDLTFELGEEWQQRTLEDLEQFRIQLSCLRCFGSGQMSFLKSTKSSSILVVISLPQHLFPINFRQTDLHEFLRVEQVLKVLSDGECVLDLEKLAEYERRLFELCEHESSDFELVQLLKQPGVNPNIYNEDGRTALWIASSHGKNSTVRTLIQHGAKVDLPNNDGDTALHNAVASGQLDVAHVLIEKGATVDYENKGGETALHIAARFGQLDVARVLIEKGATVDYENKDGDTALHISAKFGQSDVARVLIEKGAIVDYENKDGDTALHIAAASGHLDVVRMLIEKGATVDYEYKIGATPLIIASIAGHEEVARTLIHHGADVNHRSKNGFTALHVASQEGHEAVVSVLINGGATVDLPDQNGWTALHFASIFGQSNVACVLIEKGATIDYEDKGGNTALMLASYKGHKELVKTLLQAGAKPDIQSQGGFNSLMLATQEDHKDIVATLLSNGANPNLQEKNNEWTPLHFAAKQGLAEIAVLLVKSGANVVLQDKDGVTPYNLARISGQEEVSKLLENYYNVKEDREITEDLKEQSKHSYQRFLKILDLLEEKLLPGRVQKRKSREWAIKMCM